MYDLETYVLFSICSIFMSDNCHIYLLNLATHSFNCYFKLVSRCCSNETGLLGRENGDATEGESRCFTQNLVLIKVYHQVLPSILVCGKTLFCQIACVYHKQRGVTLSLRPSYQLRTHGTLLMIIHNDHCIFGPIREYFRKTKTNLQGIQMQCHHFVMFLKSQLKNYIIHSIEQCGIITIN